MEIESRDCPDLRDSTVFRTAFLNIQSTLPSIGINDVFSLIIKRLRNNEPVEPEYFESATVLFSDIPVFGKIVADCGPLDVIAFLGQIHSAFDDVVARFDVYKVETINDSYVVSDTSFDWPTKIHLCEGHKEIIERNLNGVLTLSSTYLRVKTAIPHVLSVNFEDRRE